MFTTAYAGGATDKSVYVRGFTISTGEIYTGGAYNTSGITAKYRRAGANAEATITLATQTVSGAHSDGGFVHVSGGVYRLDLPDAAIASGSDFVDIWVYGITDVVFTTAHIDILGGDPRAATVDANVTSISGDSIAADTLELFAEALDQTTGQLDSGSLAAGTISAASIAADAITAAKVAADVTTEIQSGLALSTQVDALEAAVIAIEADTQDIQSRLPAALVGGRIDANVGAISGDATAADNLESYTDGTDRMPVDVREINSTVVQGVGTALNKWRA